MFMLQHFSFCTCILASISIPLFYIYMTSCNPCGNYTSWKQFYGLQQHDHMIPIGIWVYHLPLSKSSQLVDFLFLLVCGPFPKHNRRHKLIYRYDEPKQRQNYSWNQGRRDYHESWRFVKGDNNVKLFSSWGWYKIILHVFSCIQSGMKDIYVHLIDTDIVVILVEYMPDFLKINNEVCISSVCAVGVNIYTLSINAITDYVGIVRCKKLLFFARFIRVRLYI